MANIASSAKNVKAVVTPSKIAVGTSGDTLTYSANTAQELMLFNNSASAVNVTITGSTATTVTVPKAGAATFSVSGGLVVSVPANGFAFVPLDDHAAYLSGTVSITAATAGVVYACILA